MMINLCNKYLVGSLLLGLVMVTSAAVAPLKITAISKMKYEVVDGNKSTLTFQFRVENQWPTHLYLKDSEIISSGGDSSKLVNVQQLTTTCPFGSLSTSLPVKGVCFVTYQAVAPTLINDPNKAETFLDTLRIPDRFDHFSDSPAFGVTVLPKSEGGHFEFPDAISKAISQLDLGPNDKGSITLYNTGGAPITNYGVTLDGFNVTENTCASAAGTLASNDSCRISYDISDKPTAANFSIVATGTGADTSPQTLAVNVADQGHFVFRNLSDTAISRLDLSPGAGGTVTLHNTGGVTITNYSLDFGGLSSYVSNNTCAAAVSAGNLPAKGSCSFQYNVTNAPAGDYSIIATGTSVDNKPHTLPVNVATKGHFVFRNAAGTVDFSRLDLAPEATATVTLYNTGATTITNYGVNFGSLASYVSENTCPASGGSLASAAHCSFKYDVTNTPAGDYSVALTGSNVDNNSNTLPINVASRGHFVFRNAAGDDIETLNLGPAANGIVNLYNTGGTTITNYGVALGDLTTGSELFLTLNPLTTTQQTTLCGKYGVVVIRSVRPVSYKYGVNYDYNIGYCKIDHSYHTDDGLSSDQLFTQAMIALVNEFQAGTSVPYKGSSFANVTNKIGGLIRGAPDNGILYAANLTTNSCSSSGGSLAPNAHCTFQYDGVTNLKDKAFSITATGTTADNSGHSLPVTGFGTGFLTWHQDDESSGNWYCEGADSNKTCYSYTFPSESTGNVRLQAMGGFITNLSVTPDSKLTSAIISNTCSTDLAPNELCSLNLNFVNVAPDTYTIVASGAQSKAPHTSVKSTLTLVSRAWAFISNKASVVMCKVTASGFQDCTDVGGPTVNDLQGIGVDVTNPMTLRAYFADKNGVGSKIIRCVVHNRIGELLSCTDIAAPSLGGGGLGALPQGITLNPTSNRGIFVSINNALGQPRIGYCSSSLLSCANTNASSISNPTAMGLNPMGNLAFIVDSGNKVIRCDVDVSTRAFSNCEDSGVTGLSGAAGVVLNTTGIRAFITNETANTVTRCDSINTSTTASPPTCVSKSDPLFDGPAGIALNAAGTKAFVTNKTNNKVIRCDVATNGDFSNCKDMAATNLSSPVGIALVFVQ